MTSYKQAREDFEYLETLAPLNDHVSIMNNMTEFMETPTRKYAAGLYESSIVLWFGERPSESIDAHHPDIAKITPRCRDIAERYGC